MSPTVVRSLQIWLVFGGAAFMALRLAARCGDSAVPRAAVALLAPLLVILPVGVLLVIAYHRAGKINVWEAIGRAVLIALAGALCAALVYSCEM